MSDDKPTSRQRTLANFRSHLLLTSITVTSAFALVISLSVFVPLAAHLGREPVNYEIAPGLAEHFLFLHSALWPIIGLSLIGCIASSTLLFQRMRSPLVRFKRCFEEIERGAQPAPIVIRNTDYLRDESDALNRMLQALASRAATRREAAERFDEIVHELSAREVDPIVLDELVGIVKSALSSPTQSVSEGDADT